MGSLADKMGDVETRLAAADSGKITQEKEEEIVVVLTDLIKVMEESQKPDPNARQPNKRDRTQDGQGEGKPTAGRGKSDGSKRGRSRRRTAESPATGTDLPSPFRGIKLQSNHRTGLIETGDWSELPPRKRQEMKELMQKRLSEKYREAVRLYLQRKAEIDTE